LPHFFALFLRIFKNCMGWRGDFKLCFGNKGESSGHGLF
jgi:hypothetical protein